jgi:hypothetical protein
LFSCNEAFFASFYAQKTSKQTNKTHFFSFTMGGLANFIFKFILFHVLILHSSNLGAGLLLGANEIRGNHFGKTLVPY